MENKAKKEEIASKIKELVKEVNEQIYLANNLYMDIRFTQNEKMGLVNSHLCVSISETITY